MERDQDGRGVRLSHIMKIQCFSNKSNSARRACCQNTVQEIPPRYPKGLFKSCSLHIAYLNTDSWSSESTHLGHCANPYSPLKKKYMHSTYTRLILLLSLPRKTIPFWNTKAKTQSGNNPHGVVLCYFMYPKKEKYSKNKFSDYYSHRPLYPRFFF